MPKRLSFIALINYNLHLIIKFDNICIVDLCPSRCKVMTIISKCAICNCAIH